MRFFSFCDIVHMGRLGSLQHLGRGGEGKWGGWGVSKRAYRMRLHLVGTRMAHVCAILQFLVIVVIVP